MGMKIWTLEKVHRVMHAMFDQETGEQAVLTNGRSHTSAAPARAAKHVELSQLLQHEKMYGTVDREWMSEMVPFRGYYIYVHDMDEKTRPVMMRDYARPQTKEQGNWPQLKLTGPGRCPFVDDPGHRQRLAEQAQAEQKAKPAPRTRAATALQATKGEKAVLVENSNLARRNTVPATMEEAGAGKPLDPPKSIPLKRGSTDTLPLFGSAQISRRPTVRYAGGEPVASGVQPSNITSAIKSQMISSTAAAPGAKAGTSRELNALKRKVLEKNNVQSANGMPTSYLNDVRAAINNGTGARDNKRKAEALAHIEEEEVIVTDADEQPVRTKAPLLRKKVEKDPKPGYCENCREKFDDFDTVSSPVTFQCMPYADIASTSLDASTASLQQQPTTGENLTTFSACLSDL
jgi:regulatory subunit for Cdc7p protein kinase